MTDHALASAGIAPEQRYDDGMATIQIRDVPEDVAEVFRRRAEASGRSLQSYMREQLIELAHRRNKAKVMAILEESLANDPGPGASEETINEALQELRGE